MRVVIAGASGLIGSALTARLVERGDDVLRLVRREPAGRSEARWSPATGELDPGLLYEAHAVVNLSGASLARLPWTRSYRREIVASRVTATQTIVAALYALHVRGDRVPALINASATGIYGDRPGESLDESSRPGTGFLADVVRAWEAAARTAPEGTRIVLARSGMVLARGGAMMPLRLLVRLGLGGPISGGRQHWPWIALDDEVSALVHLVDSDLHGPANLVGPTPATAGQLLRELARQLHRPYWLPIPLAGLLGDAGRDLFGSDQRVRPGDLLGEGFVFAHPTVGDAIAATLS